MANFSLTVAESGEGAQFVLWHCELPLSAPWVCKKARRGIATGLSIRISALFRLRSGLRTRGELARDRADQRWRREAIGGYGHLRLALRERVGEAGQCIGPGREAGFGEDPVDVSAVCNRPVWPSPTPRISTATIGAAASAICSADCAARLDQASRLKVAGKRVVSVARVGHGGTPERSIDHQCPASAE